VDPQRPSDGNGGVGDHQGNLEPRGKAGDVLALLLRAGEEQREPAPALLGAVPAHGPEPSRSWSLRSSASVSANGRGAVRRRWRSTSTRTAAISR